MIQRAVCLFLFACMTSIAAFAQATEDFDDDPIIRWHDDEDEFESDSDETEYVSILAPAVRAGARCFFDGGVDATVGMRVSFLTALFVESGSAFSSPALIDVFFEGMFYNELNGVESYGAEFAFGFLASFESASAMNRRWLVPYYGFKIGKLIYSDAVKETEAFVFSPVLGVRLFHTRFLYLSIEASSPLALGDDFARFFSFEPTFILGFTY